MSSRTQFGCICVLNSLLFLGFIGSLQAQTGTITTFAGNGTAGYSGDGLKAPLAELQDPTGVAVDSSGNVFVADFVNNRIRRIDHATQIVSTVAGNGTAGYTGNGCPTNGGSEPGDGGPATQACLSNPSAVAVDSLGNIFIADFSNGRIRKVDGSGTITTVAGGGLNCPGDGLRATSACLIHPSDVVIDTSGNMFIADTTNNRIREVFASNQVIATVAGDGIPGFSGDGGLATKAQLNQPTGIALDGSGDLYIADHYNNRIREVTASAGYINTIAGNGIFGYASTSNPNCPNNVGPEPGDGGRATSACLNGPSRVSVAEGRIFIGDTLNERVRVVQNGIIQTFAGGAGSFLFCGDGGPALQACLYNPQGLAAISGTDVYIADASNNRIRYVGGGPCTPAAPTIVFNGQNIAGKTSFVTVGQQITLSGTATSPECALATASQSWSKPSENNAPTMKAIGGYVASAASGSVTPLPANTGSTSYGPFYFVYPGIYTMTYQYTLTNGTKSPVSIATFNAAGPIGGYLPVVPYPGLTMDFLSACTWPNGKQEPAGNWLVYGKLSGTICNSTGTPGMLFKTPVNYQNSSGGRFFFVQLISRDVETGAFTFQSNGGLDDFYPYPGMPTSDAPNVGVLNPPDNSQTMDVIANMFLMWQSSTPNSIPVPLGYQTWGVSGTATCAYSCGTAKNWIVTTSQAGPIGKFIVSNASQTSVGNNTLQYGYPTWTGRVQD